MNTSDTGLPTPKFIIFHYFIKWFIEHFGLISYLIIIVGSIFLFCIYALILSIRKKEWDRMIMILIFALIIVGGLVGLGFDISNGHPIALK